MTATTRNFPALLWRRTLRLLTPLAACVSGVISGSLLLSLGARLDWRLDLLTHFQLQYFLGAFAAGLICLGAGRRRLALWPLFLVVLTGSRLAGYFWTSTWLPPARATQPVKSVATNLFVGNRDARAMLNWIAKEQPDLILVMEYTAGWQACLEPLHAAYPHRVLVPRRDPFGIGLFSKLPVLNQQVHRFGADGWPALQVAVETESGPLTVFGLHPPPPISAAFAELRNEQLRAVRDWAQAVSGPRILLGDLNCTMWSPYGRDLLRQGQWVDGRTGRGLQPSWPGGIWPLRIPIDHTLVSQDLNVVERRLGPDIGSDHLPVILTVARAGAPLQPVFPSAVNDAAGNESQSPTSP